MPFLIPLFKACSQLERANPGDRSGHRKGTPLVVESSRPAGERWNANNRELLQRLPHDGEVTAVPFNKDGTRLATGSADHTVRIWDVADGSQLELLRHDEAVSAVAFSPDGTQLATVSDDSARIWDVAGL